MEVIQAQGGDSFTILYLSGGQHVHQLVDREYLDPDLFRRLEILLARGQTLRDEQMHQLIADSRRRVKRTKRVQRIAAITRFFLKFASSGITWILSRFERSGGDFQQFASDDMADVVNHDDSILIQKRNDRHGAIVQNRLSRIWTALWVAVIPPLDSKFPRFKQRFDSVGFRCFVHMQLIIAPELGDGKSSRFLETMSLRIYDGP